VTALETLPFTGVTATYGVARLDAPEVTVIFAVAVLFAATVKLPLYSVVWNFVVAARLA